MRPDQIHQSLEKEKKKKLMIQEVLVWAFAAGLFTWFSVTSLVSGKLPMNAGVGRTEIIEKGNDPNFWLALTFFFVVALAGWAAFIWQGLRYLKQKKNDHS